MGSRSPTDGHEETSVLQQPRNASAETPQGETEARHPGEVGGWQFRAFQAQPPHKALGWALGTRPAESREEPHTHLLASLAGGGKGGPSPKHLP